MRSVSTSAPGKVILGGEYAVLDGAPAVSMAVDRRATVTLRKAGTSSVTLTGISNKTDTRLLDCVCETLGIDRPAGELVLDTREFSDPASRAKLGVGSSAALAVALVTALGSPERDETYIFERAFVAHSKFQGGAGSGVDVATSTAGGLIEYRIGVPPKSIEWPDGLHYALLWSGVAASTNTMLKRLQAGSGRPSLEALAQAAAVIAERWQRGDATGLIGEYRHYVAALRHFDVDHGLGIFDAGHDVLAAYKAPANIVYKPCGAGGGDVGIVLGTDPEAIREFADHACANGFLHLDMALDRLGVSVTGALP